MKQIRRGGELVNVLVIGSGGREHALVWKLSQSPLVHKIYCAPGNGGIAGLATCVPIPQNDLEGLKDFALREKIDVTVVGPEEPLLLGIVDLFQKAGLKIYGPEREAALIEGSKSFAKDLMKRYGIPTAKYEEFSDFEGAWQYVEQQGVPIVIKADGLAAGKGVVVARTMEEARLALEEMLLKGSFGSAGEKVVIEEFLEGEELTLLSFVDGETVLPMEAAQDHKAAFDGDQGPNTGGMGCYSPVPQIRNEEIQRAVKEIIQPIANALVRERKPFRGVLYTGLMMTTSGPKVIEFNARFGDPEAQVILPRLKTDLMEIILATLEGRLHTIRLEWSPSACLTVIMASPGYPGKYPKGLPITGLDHVDTGIHVFHAGTSLEADGVYRTTGGRVLAVTATGSSISSAKERAYEGIRNIHFEGAHFRKDIGDRALIR